MKKERIKWQGCNEDCFNCRYPDFLKPINKMKSERRHAVIPRKHSERQAGMFSFVFGECGGKKIRNKYYY